MSVYNDILGVVVNEIAALEGLGSSNVKKRRLPTAQETIDTLPIICVVPSDPETHTPLSYCDDVIVYSVSIVLIDENLGKTAEDLDAILAWRQAIRRAFSGKTKDGLPTIYNMSVIPDVPIDVSELNNNYDYSGVGISFSSVETRG